MGTPGTDQSTASIQSGVRALDAGEHLPLDGRRHELGVDGSVNRLHPILHEICFNEKKYGNEDF